MKGNKYSTDTFRNLFARVNDLPPAAVVPPSLNFFSIVSLLVEKCWCQKNVFPLCTPTAGDKLNDTDPMFLVLDWDCWVETYLWKTIHSKLQRCNIFNQHWGFLPCHWVVTGSICSLRAALRHLTNLVCWMSLSTYLHSGCGSRIWVLLKPIWSYSNRNAARYRIKGSFMTFFFFPFQNSV